MIVFAIIPNVVSCKGQQKSDTQTTKQKGNGTF